MGRNVTSLSNLIDVNSTRSVIDANVCWPLREKKPPLLVPPAEGADFGGIGTAYDYWLRCQIKSGITDTFLGYRVCLERHFNNRAAQKCLHEHCKTLESFWAGSLPDSGLMLEACLFLAKFDTEYRTGYRVESLLVEGGDVAELARIVARTDLDRFKGKDVVLNPLFTIRGSRLTIQADGDLVVEDTLVDLKTGSRIDRKDNLRQLIGYWILNDLVEPRIRINRLGVYYARFNHFVDSPVSQLLSDRQRKTISAHFSQLLGTELVRAKSE